MKKVLIITYYWPPAGGIGVLRCLKFAKYLRDFGWEPIIYTAKNAQYPYYDSENEKDIPNNIEIIQKSIIEPFTLFKILTGKKKDTPMSNPLVARDKKPGILENFMIWFRGNFFIPDARALWIKPSVRFLTKYIKSNPVDAILSDGPPHTNTMIACKLSVKLGIPWLADFQDPWTQVDYYKLFKISKWADRIHRKMEQRTFKTAKKITIASPQWKKDLESIGAKNVDVIYWGYDEDDFEGLEYNSSEKFTICHAGIFGSDRLPENFFKVLKELCNEVDGFKEDLVVDLYGMVDFSIEESIKANNLEDNTTYNGTVPRKTILKKVSSAHMLLLPLNKSENILGRIPGKLFEYLRSYVPIICLGPNGSDVHNIITELKAGQNFTYETKGALKQYILAEYESHKISDISTTPKRDIAKYSVKNQTKTLSLFLNEITS
ncbi:MAG: glycosyltransferase [Bacteroidota bacterium]